MATFGGLIVLALAVLGVGHLICKPKPMGAAKPKAKIAKPKKEKKKKEKKVKKQKK